MKNILVATDGSETAKQALLEARELAECRGSKVKIIHVRPDSLIPLYINTDKQIKSYEAIMEHEKESSELLLEDALKVFEGFVGQVTTVSKSGDAAEEIMREAEEGNHDLIIMGNRGLGTFSRKMLGSVANKVLNHSKKRILIIQ